jgi:AcrR family transcriptional regulator
MQERSQETRDRILKAAVKTFAEKGYEASGVAQICTRSKVSKGSFYHHFKSKQSLFLELLKDWLNGIDVELARTMEAATSVPEGLVAMAGQMKAVFSAADGSVQLFLEFWQQARRHPAVWKEFISPYRRYQQYFGKIIERGIKEGSIRPLNSKVAGQALVALAVGILVQGVLEPKGGPWDKVATDAVRLLVSGMRSVNGHRGEGT